MKNLITRFIVTLTFCSIGFAISQEGQGGIAGSGKIFLLDADDQDYQKVLIGFCFCSTACSIVSGSLVERCNVETFACFTFVMSSIIYPIFSCWCWGGGWLEVFGFHDFAGSGVVHLSAGLAGMIGTTILGPRIGFFRNKAPSQNSFEHARMM